MEEILLADQMTFKRHEIKYMITTEQFSTIKDTFSEYMIADKHGKNTICSLYYDTPDFLLIRRSIEHPVYKEKLRLRSYGVAKSETPVFVELKKKYKKVVYKRRILLPEREAMTYLSCGQIEKTSQITKELDYFMEFYKNLQPTMFLSYSREAFYAKDNPEFRITFDTDILWRNYDLCLTKGIYGTPVLEPDKILMEIKTADAIPLWLVQLLSEHKIYKTSFSKYGTAYRTILRDLQYAQGNNSCFMP